MRRGRRLSADGGYAASVWRPCGPGVEEDEVMSAALSTVETTCLRSQLVSLSSAAIKQLGATPVVEFWGASPTQVSMFASELPVELSAADDIRLLRHWNQNPLPARVVAMTRHDSWYDVPDVAAIRELLPRAWNATLSTAEMWELSPGTRAELVASGSDVVLLEAARWIMCCGADGEVAQLIVIEPRGAREAAQHVAVSLGLSLQEAADEGE